MKAEAENLDFVTINGLLAYGEAIARRPPVEGAEPPPPGSFIGRSSTTDIGGHGRHTSVCPGCPKRVCQCRGLQKCKTRVNSASLRER